jgi:hypothetical protein
MNVREWKNIPNYRLAEIINNHSEAAAQSLYDARDVIKRDAQAFRDVCYAVIDEHNIAPPTK